MTTAQGKLFKDFWELHSRFSWENTNILEIFLSKSGNVPLLCLFVCECAAAQNTNPTLNPSSIPSRILEASTTQAMSLNKTSISYTGLAVLDPSTFPSREWEVSSLWWFLFYRMSIVTPVSLMFRRNSLLYTSLS